MYNDIDSVYWSGMFKEFSAKEDTEKVACAVAIIKELRKAQTVVSRTWIQLLSDLAVQHLQQAAALVQKNRKADMDLKTYAFMINSEIDMHLNGDSEPDVTPPASKLGATPAIHSPVSPAGSLFDGDLENGSRAASSAPSRQILTAVANPPHARSTYVIPSLSTQSSVAHVDNASISVGSGAASQGGDMDVDLDTAERPSLGPAIQLRDSSPGSTSSNFPSRENLISVATRNTYVPYEYQHWPADGIARERKEKRDALRRAVQNVENNGVPDDEKWIPFPDAGQVLQDLYDAEARLKKENAPDTLEAVQDLIHALTVGLDQARLRKQ